MPQETITIKCTQYYAESLIVCLSQQCMSKRFDGSQQALDLNNIRTDPGKDTFPDMVVNELISLEQVIII